MKIYAKTIKADWKQDFRPNLDLLKKGGVEFKNLERSLPSLTPEGITITYMQYDANPSYLNTAKDKSRDSTRIIIGSDGKSYCSFDFYNSFIRLDKEE